MSSHGHERLDAAARVLGWFLAMMPAHRTEWREAMRAELYHVSGGARWTFVLGCGWVVVCTRAREGGAMVSFSRLRQSAVVTACGGGALMVAPMIGLSGASAGIAALWTLDAALLFGLLWALAATAVFTAVGLITSRRDGPRRQWLVVLQVAVLVLAAGGWLVISRDQMPCFLGKPNCD